METGIINIFETMNGFLFRSLMICNYINKLPRCLDSLKQEARARLLRTDTGDAGLIAKQTQGRGLEVGELGYLSSSLVTQSSGPRVTAEAAMMTILAVMVMSVVNL